MKIKLYMMNRRLPVLVIVVVYLIQETANTEHNPDCVVDYVFKMHCTWSKGSYTGDGPFFLLINSSGTLYSCNFSIRRDAENSYNCTTLILDGFSILQEYTMQPQSPNGIDGSDIFEIFHFIPSDNIKTNPPFDLLYNFSDNKYNITWSVDVELTHSLKEHLEYEIEIKKENSAWANAKRKQVRYDTYVEIEMSELERDTEYVVHLRCKTTEAVSELYISNWSEWSSELRFHTITQEAGASQYIVFPLAAVICTLIVLYVFFNFHMSSRVKVLFTREIPTAAKFFQPLYKEYNGNFQDWAKPRLKPLYSPNGGKSRSVTDLDFPSMTVLCFHKEVFSNIDLVMPLSSEHVTQDICDMEDYSQTFNQDDVSFNDSYPAILQELNTYSYQEKTTSHMDILNSYISYDKDNFSAGLHSVSGLAGEISNGPTT